MNNQTLIILGSFISVLLGLNAFFLKDILKNLNELKLVFTVLNTEHNIYAELARENKEYITNLRERVHSLEGAQLQVLSFIEKYDKGK